VNLTTDTAALSSAEASSNNTGVVIAGMIIVTVVFVLICRYRKHIQCGARSKQNISTAIKSGGTNKKVPTGRKAPLETPASLIIDDSDNTNQNRSRPPMQDQERVSNRSEWDDSPRTSQAQPVVERRTNAIFSANDKSRGGKGGRPCIGI